MNMTLFHSHAGVYMNTDFYNLNEKITQDPLDASHPFYLHTHDRYEILLFLAGDSNYIIEDRSYELEPYDMIIIRKHQFHRIHHNSSVPYHRIVLFLQPDFFKEYKCQEYEEQFANANVNIGSKIPAEIVLSSGLLDAFQELAQYSKNYTADPNSPIMYAQIIKILYLIHQVPAFSKPLPSTSSIKSVIHYLNNNFTQDIDLEMLENKFFLSKYYLCRAFRKATGLTIQEYIRGKRLVLARELRTEGLSWLEAAIRAGFPDYSAFYRAYTKEYGAIPSKDAISQKRNN